MQVNVEKLDKNRAVLEVEVMEEEVARALHQAYRKVVRRFNIPGFRKGKAPRPILERFMGKEVLYREALDCLLPVSYDRALEQANLDPIDQPEVEVLQLEEGKPFRFKATVEVKPEVELGDYLKVREEIPFEPVSGVPEEDVNKHIEQIREQKARLVVDERGQVREDSFAIVDLSGEMDGKPFPPEKVEGHTIQMGTGGLPPGFEEQLKGAKVDEEREITVTYPEDYGDKDLAGKRAVFRVLVREVKRREIPPLDDEFAREVGAYQTLQELKNELANRLKAMAEEKAKMEYERKVVEAVVAGATVELPDTLISRQFDAYREDLEGRLRQQNLTMDRYLELAGQTEDGMMADLRSQAEKTVKRELVLEAVARKEGIKAMDEEVEQEAAKLAGMYGQPADAMKKFFTTGDRADRIRRGIVRRKTVELLAYGHEGPPTKSTPEPVLVSRGGEEGAAASGAVDPAAAGAVEGADEIAGETPGTAENAEAGAQTERRAEGPGEADAGDDEEKGG